MIQAKEFQLDINKRTHIMGILNVTPDSFSDGGNYYDIEKAVARAKKMEAEGADIIDIGGESTRPGHTPISGEEEARRIIPVIEALKETLQIPISVDTYKATVAEQAVKAGASIINDIWGAKREPKIAEVAARYDVPIILMHNRMDMDYKDFMMDVKADLQESISIAKQAGVKDSQIILDPGIGFAKTMEQNQYMIKELQELITLGYPLLLAASRKKFIGEVLHVPADQRDVGTAATTVIGIGKGARIVRVHDVKINREAARVADAIYQTTI
ncbi:dihydropteroate synthase [Oceanobacillus sp. J11TS1]|uniref:dihydropteroate synthase n=1 Tax=Oceanobacillus sp. J11TS1 TaxID=2807191 RepID=UPI001B29E153|nr:dihydropteroate synthase [Oceanobacillus sp. J11TS1]GIO24223.1 dihydropteroate synthase [Oceanobacillus sp. J11TS1]